MLYIKRNLIVNWVVRVGDWYCSCNTLTILNLVKIFEYFNLLSRLKLNIFFSKNEEVRAQELVLCDNPGCENPLTYTVSNVRRKHVAAVQVLTCSESQRKVTIW